jgi:uncharacterized membrane protein
MNLNKTARYLFPIIALAGFADSVYLSWVKLSSNEALCLPGVGNCAAVSSSRYSTFLGIPMAVYGALGYLAILLVYGLATRNKRIKEISGYVLFGLTLFGIVISGYLTYLELFVIHAICPFCVLSALCMVCLFIITIFAIAKPQADN